MRALIDTNILIDYLSGISKAKKELERYKNPMISCITWMEIMVGATKAEEPKIRRFLLGFKQVAIDQKISESAVDIRKSHRIKLPYAIIWASSRTQEAILVTRNTKDFPGDTPEIRIPYKL